MIWPDVDAVCLDAILDELIPANLQRDIPAAGAAGVADFLSDKAQTDAGFHAAVSSLLVWQRIWRTRSQLILSASWRQRPRVTLTSC